MTPQPVLAVDETGQADGEVPASGEEDGGSRDSKLPSVPPDTSKCVGSIIILLRITLTIEVYFSVSTGTCFLGNITNLVNMPIFMCK